MQMKARWLSLAAMNVLDAGSKGYIIYILALGGADIPPLRSSLS